MRKEDRAVSEKLDEFSQIVAQSEAADKREMRKFSGKREFDSQAGGLAQKRRFVWPESLHQDFVAAVFDAGLKHLIEGDSEYVWRPIIETHSKATPSQIRRHVQKILAYRVGEKKQRMSEAAKVSPSQADDSANANEGVSTSANTSVGGKELAERAEDETALSGSAEEPPASLEPTYAELAQVYKNLDDAKQVVQMEKHYKALIEAKLEKQSKLFKKLSDMIRTHDSMRQSGNSGALAGEAYRPGRYNASRDEYDYSQADIGGSDEENLRSVKERRGQGRSSARSSSSSSLQEQQPVPLSELAVLKEMRENIEVHRRLLLQKEEQLSRHGNHNDLNQVPMTSQHMGGLHFHNGAVMAARPDMVYTGVGVPMSAAGVNPPSYEGFREKTDSREYSLSLNREQAQSSLTAAASSSSLAKSSCLSLDVYAAGPAPPEVGLPENQSMDFDQLDVDRLFGFLNDPEGTRF